MSDSSRSRPETCAWNLLPDELVLQILNDVRNNLDENPLHLIREKWQDLVEIEGEEPDELEMQQWASYRPGEVTVLNSFQSLAVVNQRTYRLCRPLLWERLKFPSLLPMHMYHWLHNLLPRQGPYVRSLTVTLSADWLKESPSFAEPSRPTHSYSLRSLSSQVEKRGAEIHPGSSRNRDNLSLLSFYESELPANHWSSGFHSPQPLSPDSIHAVLLRCPNICSLKLETPFQLRGRSAPNPSRDFQSRLLPLLLSLPKLQNLDLNCYAPYNFDAGRMSQALVGLPLLESLKYHASEEDRNDEVGTRAFVTRLSELKHMRFLTLDSYPATLLSKPCHSLTSLNVSGCASHTFEQSCTQLDISQFAPNLTRLSLFLIECGKGNWSANACLGSNINNTQRYQFPLLKKLIVMNFHPNCDFIIRFQACKQIELISWGVLPRLDFSLIIELVCSSNWPMLKTLRLTGVFDSKHPDSPTHPGSMKRLPKLSKFCQEKGIELLME